MLIGYNNDVEHRGKTFHIQTEDRGINDDTIETQLFCGGAILDTIITNYSEHVAGLEGKPREKKIKSIMQASHRSLFKKLMAGEYDEMVGLAPLKEKVDVEDVDFQPGQDRVPVEAMKIEEGDLEGFGQSGDDGHVDLSQLKSKLAGLKAQGGGGESEAELEEESEVPATTIMEVPSEVVEDPAPKAAATQDDPRSRLKARLATKKVAPETEEVEISMTTTGIKAWTGCEEPAEDLSLTALVEEFLAG